jgi:hypothetical protein
MTSNVRQRKECCRTEKGEGVWVNDVVLGEKEGVLKRMTRMTRRERESPNVMVMMNVMRRLHVFRQ